MGVGFILFLLLSCSAQLLDTNCALFGGTVVPSFYAQPIAASFGAAARFPSLCKLSLGARWAFLIFPATYDATANTTKHPLVVDMHGTANIAEFGADIAATGVHAAELWITLSAYFKVADSDALAPFILEIQGSGPTTCEAFNAGLCCCDAAADKVDDVSFISTLVQNMNASGKLDADRVYLNGHSNGAYMAQRLACQTDLFAGMVVNSGPLVYPQCTPSKKIHIMAVHGTADARVPYNGGSVDFGHLPSEANTMLWWRGINGCQGFTPVTISTNGNVECVQHCSIATGGVDMVLCTITGGVHTYFGSYLDSKKNFDTTVSGWAFLSTKTRNTQSANPPPFNINGSTISGPVVIVLCLLLVVLL